MASVVGIVSLVIQGISTYLDQQNAEEQQDTTETYQDEQTRIQTEQIEEERVRLEKENFLAKREAYNRANVLDANAFQLDTEAAGVGAKGVEDLVGLQTEGKQFVGQQVAKLSGTGAVVGAGTSGQLLSESERTVLSDASTLRSNYVNKRKSMESEAQLMRDDAVFQREQGDLLSDKDVNADPDTIVFNKVNPKFSKI